MKWAIISDVHSNIEALEAVLKDINTWRVERIIQLGDLVGYNANPRECIELARQEGMQGVHGNHDLAALDLTLSEGFNLLAHQAILFTRSQLDDISKRYLEKLPFCLILEGEIAFFHGSPENVNTYIMNLYQARRAFNYILKQLISVRIAFFGHTHVRRLWHRDRVGKIRSIPLESDIVSLKDDGMYLINPGSVGQPRQGDNRAHYLIFDLSNKTIIFRSVPYDIHKAQEKILKAKLPEFLALRLSEGI
ncbi:MAG: metallophosphatase family protein [Syntrophobacterales bacterium]|nr:metallophosphatase family protein [Syntrophobacterales bacterium]